jgi:hypothetical protein
MSGQVGQFTEIVVRKPWLWRSFVIFEAPRFVEALQSADGFLGNGFYSLNKPPPRFMPQWLRYMGTLWLAFLGLPVSKPWHHLSVVWWRDRAAAAEWTSSPPAARMREWLNAHADKDVSYWTAEMDVPSAIKFGDGVGPDGRHRADPEG